VGVVERWRGWAKRLKREIYALYLVYRDPRTTALLSHEHESWRDFVRTVFNPAFTLH